MISKVYISPSLGQAIFYKEDKAFMINSDSNSDCFEFDSKHLNDFLSYSLEINKLDIIFNSTKEVKDYLNLQIINSEALQLSIDVMNSELPYELRKLTIKGLEEYISKLPVLEYCQNRLFAFPLPQNLDVKLAIEICNSDLCFANSLKFYKELLLSIDNIKFIKRAFEFIIPDFISSEKINEFNIALIDNGIIRAFVLALNKRSKKDMDSILITYSTKSTAIKKFISNPVFLFKEVENFIFKYKGSEIIETKLQIEGNDNLEENNPIIQLIKQFDEDKKVIKKPHQLKAIRKKSGTEILNKVQSQIEKIIEFLLKDKIAAAHTILIQLTKYQVNNSSKEQLLKTYSDIAMRAAKNDFIDFALQILGYSECLFINDAILGSIKAEIKRRQNKPEEALIIYNEVIAQFPYDVVGKCGKVETLRDLGMFEDALTDYQNIISQFPNEVIAKCGKAETLCDIGKFDEALKEYDTIITQFPNNVIAKGGKAEVLRDLGMFDDALKEYQSIINSFPNEVVARNGKAETLRDLGRFEEALNEYQNIVSKFPNNVIAKSGKAETLRDLGRFEEALNEYQNIISKFPNNVIAKNGKAETLRDLSRFGEALKEYKSIVSQIPNNVIAKCGKAGTLRDLGRFEESLIEYQNIILKFPFNKIARSSYFSLQMLVGNLEVVEERYKQLKDVGTFYASDWLDFHVIGMAYLKRGIYSEAIKIFEKGCLDNPFLKSKKYFQSAFALSQFKKNNFKNSLDILLNNLIRPIDYLLVTHAYAGDNQKEKAKEKLHMLENNQHPKIQVGLARLSERYNLNGYDKTGLSNQELDNEIFEIEFELVIQ
jgi:tetratricopeptide (TPR) repeat protein